MFNPNDLYEEKNQEDDDGSGSGSSGGSGFDEPIMDMAIFGLVQGRIREGEKKWGIVPDPREPHRESEGLRSGNRLRSHPLLSKAAEFNGIDKNLNPNPMQNPEAEHNQEDLRNEHALRLGQQLGKKQRLTVSAPRLTRGGG